GGGIPPIPDEHQRGEATAIGGGPGRGDQITEERERRARYRLCLEGHLAYRDRPTAGARRSLQRKRGVRRMVPQRLHIPGRARLGSFLPAPGRGRAGGLVTVLPRRGEPDSRETTEPARTRSDPPCYSSQCPAALETPAPRRGHRCPYPRRSYRAAESLPRARS